MNSNNNIVAIENVKITSRNFRGEEGQFNAKGDRNFVLDLTEEQAAMLTDEGFRIRVRPPKEEYQETRYFLPVKVSYKFRDPKIVLISGTAKRLVTEDTVDELDYAEISYIDITIRKHHWTMPGGNSGINAYLNSMYVTLVEDEFASKYADDENPF